MKYRLLMIMISYVTTMFGEQGKTTLSLSTESEQRQAQQAASDYYQNYKAEKTVGGYRFTHPNGAVYEWSGVPIEPLVAVKARELSDGMHSYEITVTNKNTAANPIVEVWIFATDWRDRAFAEFRNSQYPFGWTIGTFKYLWDGQLRAGDSATFVIESRLGPDKLSIQVTGANRHSRDSERADAITRGVPMQLLFYSKRYANDYLIFRVFDVLQ